MDFSNIKFVLSEMDGIITEHLSGIGEMGITMFKQYYMKDFEAINLIKRDWGFAFISSDANINMSLAKKRNLPFFHAERHKKGVYNSLLRRYNLTSDNVLYIGSSYSDIECLRASGIALCPEDAVPQVKNVVQHVIPLYSGTGILCYVYELLREHNLLENRKK